MADETGAAMLDVVEAVAEEHPEACACTYCYAARGNELALAEIAWTAQQVGSEELIARMREPVEEIQEKEREDLPCPVCFGAKQIAGALCPECEGTA